MTIPAGQTQVSQQVHILQDDKPEGGEQFQVQLTMSSASADLGVTVGDNDTAVITILDDDDVLVEFSPTRYTVSEGDGVVTLTLTADSVADCNYTVEVRTQDGTATGQMFTQIVLRLCKLLLCFIHKWESCIHILIQLLTTATLVVALHLPVQRYCVAMEYSVYYTMTLRCKNVVYEYISKSTIPTRILQ